MTLLLAVANDANGDDDQELARRLVQEGRIRPLTEIVEAVRSKVPGEILEVEFDAESGIYVYKLKILSAGGKVEEVEVDAASGEISEVEGED